MAVPRSVVIVGGGVAGNAAAVLLRRAGADVDLVETDPAWGALGSGITLQGNALTVLREIGVWDEVSRNCAVTTSLPPGAPKIGDPDLPQLAGMYRPKLQEILSGAVRAAGTNVRLGVTVKSFTDDGSGVDVVLSDGTAKRYDLMIGADGLHSGTRAALGFTARIADTGLAIWRAYGFRPAEVTGSEVAHGSPHLISGYNPTGPENLYAWIVEPVRAQEDLPADKAAEFRRLAEPLTGPWPAIRASVVEQDQVDYRKFTWLCLDAPWHRGRAVLIGDAVHACPPTLAQGAAMGLEDASVLAETLRDTADLDTALDLFAKRRYDRVRNVVEASVAVCASLVDGTSPVPHFRRAFGILGTRP